MLELYNRDFTQKWLLQNAVNVTEETSFNTLDYLSFALPYNDSKNEFCQPYNFVVIDDRVYRIMPIVDNLGETGVITHQCESAIATLIDDVMIGWHQTGGIDVPTRQVIEYALNHQHTQYWRLGALELDALFEYGWQDENLYSAVLSALKPFTAPYKIDLDYTTRPWTINVKLHDLNAEPKKYVYQGQDLLAYKKSTDVQQVFTRIVPRGYGEGINQLDIKAVNNGVEWLQSPQEYIDRYGLKTLVWTDRQYENAIELKAVAQTLLNQYQEPYVEYEVQTIFDNTTQVGDRMRVGTSQGFEYFVITKITRNYADTPSMSLTVANKSKDIANTIAEIVNRQRIESTYSQGATQLYSHSTQANADSKEGAEISFYVPQETRVLNKVTAKIKVSAFRAYSSTTKSGGGKSSTTESGGKATVTDEQLTTTGETTISLTPLGTVKVENFAEPTTTVRLGQTEIDNRTAHEHYLPNLRINFEGKAVSSNHQHKLDLKFEFDIPNHKHDIEIPSHTHGITAGIYRSGSASSFTLQFNGNNLAVYNTTQAEVDLTGLLINPDTGEIDRGRWYELKIIPNDLAYIQADVFIQSFIQSRGGGQY